MNLVERPNLLLVGLFLALQVVPNGSQVTLVCNYKLSSGDQLYSIKWYKNYVEFYRFQPQPSQPQAPAGSSPADEQRADLKTEFELDGINLDLAKSNATHVHLKQVNLASEATYKCEVSADSPSFATISLERQMRVYVLPRQKLHIVENQRPSPPGGGQSNDQSGKPVYTLNDQINVTCFAGPSRPAARLTWWLNDQPVAPSSGWLSSRPNRTLSAELTETQLTLAFRLQLSHLNRTATDGGGLHSLRLRCTAKLVAEFSSETSILVSGGKASIKRRQQQQSPLPPSSSFSALSISDQDDATTATGLSIQRPQKQADRANPIYRWPLRPADEFWLASGAQSQDQDQSQRRVVHSNSQRHAVWTNRQLKAQVEHIEQVVLKRSHSNELEAPVIEARSQLDDSGDSATQQDEPTTTGEQLWTTTSEQEGDLDAEAATTASSYDHGSRTISRDSSYELNESVQFNCNAQLAPPDVESTGRSVQLKWFINDKEVNESDINAFDGTRFYYADATDGGRPTSRLSSQLEHPKDDEASERPLRLELSASLMQLNGLNLKCKTLVEQPLIEYDSQLAVSVATNPFVQATDQQQLPPSGGRFLNQNSRFNQANPNSRRLKQNGTVVRPKFGTHKHTNVYKVRQSSSSAAACCPLGLQLVVVLLISCLLGGAR